MERGIDFPSEKYEQAPSEQVERLADLKDSLVHAVHYLSGVLDDISEGRFTPDEALRTVEDMVCSEGLDFISAMEDYGHSESE